MKKGLKLWSHIDKVLIKIRVSSAICEDIIGNLATGGKIWIVFKEHILVSTSL